MHRASNFQYDAFISYASEDREWARALADALGAKGLRVFLDQEDLRAGEVWDTQLIDALDASRHLVLLSSDFASKSAWVDEELVRFRSSLDAAERRGELTGRSVIQILLEGELRRLPRHQGIHSIADADVYGGGVVAVPAELWSAVVAAVEDTIVEAADALPVPVLVLTSTRSRMEHEVEIDRTPPGGGMALGDLLTALGSDRDGLLELYGDARSDWRPFGSDRSVRLILDELKDELNQELERAGRKRLTWRYIDEASFWEDGDDAAAIEARALSARPALIVADPLALYDDLVRERYSNFLQPAFTDEHTFILVLAPFELPREAVAVRAAIQKMARQMFLHHYEPPVFEGNPYSRCAATIGDPMDFKGWLITTIGPYVVATADTPAPAVLRTTAG